MGSTDSDIQRRIDMDMLKRSMMGILMYAVLLPAVFWPFNFHLMQPELSYILAAAMLIISGLRLVHKYFTGVLYSLSADLWRALFGFLSLSHAAVLGTYFAFAIYDPRFEQLMSITMLIMGGVGSSAVVSLTPWGRFALVNLGLLMLPSVAVGLLVGNYPLAVTILLYTLFTSFIGIRSAEEYTRSFDIEIKLNEQTEELQQRNKTDGLTGIYNREHFNNEIECFWKLGSREGIVGTLLMIDVDHFKSINDNYGHLYGDKCIIHVASLISSVFKRDTDTIARFGGEEFSVLLTGCGTEHAQRLAEKVRKQVMETPFEHNGQEISITVSVGVATLLPSCKTEPNSLIQLADEALYDAKKGGRNRVKMSPISAIGNDPFSQQR